MVVVGGRTHIPDLDFVMGSPPDTLSSAVEMLWFRPTVPSQEYVPTGTFLLATLSRSLFQAVHLSHFCPDILMAIRIAGLSVLLRLGASGGSLLCHVRPGMQGSYRRWEEGGGGDNTCTCWRTRKELGHTVCLPGCWFHFSAV